MSNLTSRIGLIVRIAVWTQLECHAGLIVSCFPAVNQVLRHWLVGSDTPAKGVSGIIRRVVPGINSIDAVSMERGLKSSTVDEDRGLEVVVVPVGNGDAPEKDARGMV